MNLASRLVAYEKSRAVGTSRGAPDGALHHLMYFLTRHFRDGRKLRSIETGCGSSTVAFSNCVEHHTVYCEDDRGSVGSGVDFVQTHPEFRSEIVSFAFGATTQSIYSDPPVSPVDILMINGRHAYPIPDVERFVLQRWLKPAGLLILRGICIPTINNLFEFLRHDESLKLYSVAEATAFFSFNPGQAAYGDSEDWHAQRYNRAYYPARKAAGYALGLPVPFSLVFDGGLAELPDYFQSGFALVDGVPLTEGRISELHIPLDRSISGEVEITLDVDLLVGAERPGCGLSAYIDGAESRLGGNGSGRQELVARATLKDAGSIKLTLVSRGLRPIRDLPSLSAMRLDGHFLPNVAIRGIVVKETAERAATHGPRITRMDGSIVEFTLSENRLRFFVMNSGDSIQSHHNSGRFYEFEELDLISRHVPRGSRILDIGANIGNHTVWFEKCLDAARIVVVEPQQQVISLLKVNCLLNGLRNVDQSHLGFALGKESSKGQMRISDPFNVAGGAVVVDDSGSIDIRVGDEVFAGQEFDFIKIDVEGAEIDVMAGLKAIIARCRPVIFVEVWDHHREAVAAFIDEIGYECVDEWRRYPVCSNLLLKPQTSNGPARQEPS